MHEACVLGKGFVTGCDIYLPLGDTRAEPDVEAIAIMNGFHKAVQHDKDDLLNVKDITAWLLLKMAEPEEQDVVDWFWWHSCKLFADWTLYAEMLKNLGCKVEDHLTPKRYIIHGEPSQADLVRHFSRCGVRATDVSSRLRDFAKTYIDIEPPPAAPDWPKIP
jgi:hypothetical protein